jgi:hypothetical protein
MFHKQMYNVITRRNCPRLHILKMLHQGLFLQMYERPIEYP